MSVLASSMQTAARNVRWLSSREATDASPKLDAFSSNACNDRKVKERGTSRILNSTISSSRLQRKLEFKG